MTAPGPYGVGCSCPCLGIGTPEHAPGALCLPAPWAVIVTDDAAWIARPSTCPACPDGCGSCTRDRSDCECYEHQGFYDDDPECE